ncbi:hypothetical protein GCM10018793_54700 [Streptomyces sulfonofaciens]|uniref:HTH cro/C1-type domain-containing protein n=1 Tax=Streptomyces sulfonofaciens TaxID=68272 RepID=A0A919L6G5_9ACTN|nr:helix-turn-helix domain-containing protein [Streptomyces sulfonofaciens]GHH85693.1 hypothetical protein GCM10018793_54700 [Streptomyces sulfonofaciens]
MDDEQTLRSFSQLLRTHRQRAGLTQQHLADLATVSVRAVRNLERGTVRAPRLETVRLLAAGLGLRAAERAVLIEAASNGPRHRAAAPARYRLDPSPLWATTGAVVGREAEIATLVELLGLPGQRLVTVVGVGGVGKTRVAAEAVSRCARAQDLPARWLTQAEPDRDVPEAGAVPPGRAAPAGATPPRPGADAFGPPHGRLVPDGPAGAFAPRGPLASVHPHVPREALAFGEDGFRAARTLGEIASDIDDRPALLALDDLEACGVGVGQAMELMLRCPRLRLLVTASAPIGVPHEQVLPLAPLPVPCASDEADPVRLARNPAVRLLASHIRRFDPAFRLGGGNAGVVAQLCRALDGLPRSLEYAGSWSLVRSLEQLLDEARLDPFHTPPPPTSLLRPRHPCQGLRRTIARLEPRVRSLLAAMARRAGAWSIGEAAARAGLDEREATSMLHTLVTLGLLRTVTESGGERRFVALRQVQHLYAALPAAVC